MPPSISYYLSIVDPSNEFVDRIEERLTQTLKATDFPVRGFRNTGKYISSLVKYPYQIPIIVIADLAAVTPSLEQGVFMQTKRLVPRAICIAYTTNTFRPEWQRLKDLGAIKRDEHIVNRVEDERESILERVVSDEVDGIKKSDEYRKLTHLYKQLDKAKKLDRSQENLLIEAAKGTDKAKCFLCQSGLNKEPKSLGDPESKISMGNEPVKSTMKNLFKPGKYVWRLLRRDKLRFWERAIIEDAARYKFTVLLHQDLNLATSLRSFFDSKEFPSGKEGWHIVQVVYEEVVRLNRDK